ncbi:MAG: riboflavin synthase [Lachnospiraceae bacterium]|jgi:riboflavin synthase|nr:riboflavin synthase [Lachnospiraceae bacterium]
MFTGIIEELGQIRRTAVQGSSGQIAIQARRVLEGTRIGDSIAVNGICLTVVSLQKDGFTADVMAETLRRSSLGRGKPGELVNLERAMSAMGRFGGHLVSGHIDGTGVIRSLRREENAVWVTIEAGPEILRLIVEKGSVAIDGISLTVAAVGEEYFQVSVIPHTGEETTLLRKKPGDLVNLENDIIGKYVERLLGLSEGKVRDASVGAARELSAPSGRFGREEAASGKPGGGLTMDFLRECGI